MLPNRLSSVRSFLHPSWPSWNGLFRCCSWRDLGVCSSYIVRLTVSVCFNCFLSIKAPSVLSGFPWQRLATCFLCSSNSVAVLTDVLLFRANGPSGPPLVQFAVLSSEASSSACLQRIFPCSQILGSFQSGWVRSPPMQRSYGVLISGPKALLAGTEHLPWLCLVPSHGPWLKRHICPGVWLAVVVLSFTTS